MNNAKTKVIFEHPLNEKIRTWLRLEFLVKQLKHNKTFNQNNALLFFHLLNELLEIIEHNDIRGDLIKDLEQQKQKLSTWLNVSGVNTSLLTTLLKKLDEIINQLSSSAKLGQELKTNRFISAVRKRLAIPGGCCSFDLPSLHLWMHYPQDYRDNQVNTWFDSFCTLNQAISMYMQLIRQSSNFKSISCNNNFYQNSEDDACLLRIKFLVESGLYPQVSGNTNRYSIRFIPLDQTMNNQVNETNIDFELACC